MNKLGDHNEGGGDGGESDPEDPEQLLNEWLGELDNLTGVSIVFVFNSFFLRGQS